MAVNELYPGLRMESEMPAIKSKAEAEPRRVKVFLRGLVGSSAAGLRGLKPCFHQQQLKRPEHVSHQVASSAEQIGTRPVHIKTAHTSLMKRRPADVEAQENDHLCVVVFFLFFLCVFSLSDFEDLFDDDDIQ